MPVFQRQGGELFYDVAGSGEPPTLFIHGYSCTAGDWRLQMDGLSANCMCIALDQRGHGRSVDFDGALTIENFARDALELLDELKIGQAVLCGHSMGTRIALEAAMLGSDRVRGLVLVDGSKVEATPEAVRASILAAFEASGFEAWSDANMSGMFLDRLAPEDRDEILQRARDLGSQKGLQLYDTMTRWDQDRFPRALTDVKCPVTVIQSTSILPGGARERCLVDDAPDSPWLDGWRTVANANIQTVSMTGHFTMLEEPEVVNDVLRAKLGKA